MSQPRIQTLKYRAPTGAFNLGDTIQAVALARLLGEPTEGVFRDTAGQADDHGPQANHAGQACDAADQTDRAEEILRNRCRDRPLLAEHQ